MFHPDEFTLESIRDSVAAGRSVELDVSLDDAGEPYLGHSLDFYEKRRLPFPDSPPFWEAVALLEEADNPVTLDSKHRNSWPLIEELVEKFGPERCLVHTFVDEFKFENSVGRDDFPDEWAPIAKLKELKIKYPSLTTMASSKFLPADALADSRREGVLGYIRDTCLANLVDSVRLTLDERIIDGIDDEVLKYFLRDGIMVHINLDVDNAADFHEIYIGETGDQRTASSTKDLI
jgi:hypothetical protein